MVPVIQEVEEQAVSARQRYIGKYHEQDFVYTVKSFRTRARAWRFSRSITHLEVFFGSPALGVFGEYIDLHSSGAEFLGRAFCTMKDNTASM